MSFLSARLFFLLAFVAFGALNLRLLSPTTRSYISDNISSTLQDVQRAGNHLLTGTTLEATSNSAQYGSGSRGSISDDDNNNTPIVFAFVMFGPDSAREGLLTLKTALMHVSRPTSFHIICSEDAIPIIEEKFALFSRYVPSA